MSEDIQPPNEIRPVRNHTDIDPDIINEAVNNAMAVAFATVARRLGIPEGSYLPQSVAFFQGGPWHNGMHDQMEIMLGGFFGMLGDIHDSEAGIAPVEEHGLDSETAFEEQMTYDPEQAKDTSAPEVRGASAAGDVSGESPGATRQTIAPVGVKPPEGRR